MGILSRLLHAVRPDDDQPAHWVDEGIERIVKLHPHLRLARRYRSRLASAVAVSLEYIDDLVASVPAPRDASAATWSSDPYIHAFFARPDDIVQILSRSADLREYCEQNADLSDVYTVLGMAMNERRILGAALEGEAVRHDVAQTTLSFSDHKTRIFGRTESDLRREIVLRLIDQLGLEGLSKIEENKSRRDMLEQERALLKTRLQLLERQGVGIRAMLGNFADVESPGELGRLQAQIEENERNLSGLGIRTEALERELDWLCDILTNPKSHIYIETQHFRLDKMNTVQQENSSQPCDNITFYIARIPTTPPQMRTFTLIRFAKKDLLPRDRLLVSV